MNKVHYAYQTLQRPNDTVQYTAGDLVSRQVGLAQVPLVFDFDEVNSVWLTKYATTSNLGATAYYREILQNYPRTNYPSNPVRLEHVTAVKNSATVLNASFNLFFFDTERTHDIDFEGTVIDNSSTFADNSAFTFGGITTAMSTLSGAALFNDNAVSTQPQVRHVGPRLRYLGMYSATFTNPGLADAAGNPLAVATFVPPTGSPGIVIRRSRVLAFLVAAAAYTPTAFELFSFAIQGVEVT